MWGWGVTRGGQGVADNKELNSVPSLKPEGFENAGVCVGFSVDEKYFENEAFKKQWHRDRPVIVAF